MLRCVILLRDVPEPILHAYPITRTPASSHKDFERLEYCSHLYYLDALTDAGDIGTEARQGDLMQGQIGELSSFALILSRS